MGGIAEARRLMGPGNAGNLILMVGPESGRMQQSAALTGIPVRDARKIRDIRVLAEKVRERGLSLALIAVTPEVEGVLHRDAFGAKLHRTAHEVHRVVYYGIQGSVLVHPHPRGVLIEVRHGVIRVRHVAPSP